MSSASFLGLLIWLAIIAGLVFLAWWLKTRLFRSTLGRRLVDSVFLEVLVPKEVTEKDKDLEPAKEEKDIIGIAEQLFATLSHRDKFSLRALFGSPDAISFEIVSSDKKISFYINCPKHLRDLVEKQIHAQYPNAQIDAVTPPKVFGAGAAVATAELGLQKPFLFPVKTYKNMESDPLSALTNSLSKLQANESGVIQLVIHPARLGWRGKVNRKAREIQKGKPIDAGHSGFAKVLDYTVKGAGEVASALRSPKKRADELSEQSLREREEQRQLTPMQQEAVKRLEEKASKGAFEANIRLVVASESYQHAKNHLRNILSSFMQYTQPPFNGFRVLHRASGRVTKDYLYRALNRPLVKKMILNTEELASLFHLPTKFTQTPNIKRLGAKRAPAPIDTPEQGILLGINTYRGVKTEIKIAPDDRRRHMYVVGRTGTGKSEFLKNLARQDIANGEGLCVVDPHGDLIDDLLEFVPKERAEDVVLFEPFDLSRPMGLNMLEVRTEEEKDFAIQEMIEIFYKLFPPEMIGPMFEHNMRNVMLTLMADQDEPGTIAEIPRMFTDTKFQQYKVSKVHDPVVRAFWEQEMAKTTDFHKSEMLGYLISKVGRFVENEMMRNIIGQSRSAFNVREIMDKQKILLINLSKGKTGEVNSKLLGLIVVSKLQMAALSRADTPAEDRKDFYLYIDEFQNFVTDSIATILSEARKYKLNLVMAHQYINQLVNNTDTKIRDAVFGNAGTIISFRVGVEDAEVLAKEFAPVFNEFDVINIDRFNAYVKLMINGTASRPFNMETLPPPAGGSKELAQAIKKLAKLKYGRQKAEVAEEIMHRARLGQFSSPDPSIERTI